MKITTDTGVDVTEAVQVIYGNWITVETDPGESKPCPCEGFEWVGDTPSEGES